VGEADIDVGARLVTTGLGAVWVSQFKTGRVLKVDPTTLAVTSSAALCRGPQGILATTDVVWVTCTTDNVALRLDPAGLTVEKKVRLPEAPDGIAVGPAGGIFVVCQAGPTVVELDPSPGAVKRQRVLGGAAQLYDQANLDIAATSDAVWVSSFSENLVYRLPT
jgi:streptogramin lyase